MDTKNFLVPSGTTATAHLDDESTVSEVFTSDTEFTEVYTYLEYLAGYNSITQITLEDPDGRKEQYL